MGWNRQDSMKTTNPAGEIALPSGGISPLVSAMFNQQDANAWEREWNSLPKVRIIGDRLQHSVVIDPALDFFRKEGDKFHMLENNARLGIVESTTLMHLGIRIEYLKLVDTDRTYSVLPRIGTIGFDKDPNSKLKTLYKAILAKETDFNILVAKLRFLWNVMDDSIKKEDLETLNTYAKEYLTND